ncbi:hypothetical protein E2C01_075397 [Portunus trituberculatus]|uniref:Uncharacterized protein n=1 Tax=Portunus trituberculatus TaxID=210409 RepID=A0A5B7IF00_PORTR|nr:hypothetical protein [Portunus trituberculatus]
MWVLKVVTTSS